jgi:hypothetical protein
VPSGRTTRYGKRERLAGGDQPLALLHHAPLVVRVHARHELGKGLRPRFGAHPVDAELLGRPADLVGRQVPLPGAELGQLFHLVQHAVALAQGVLGQVALRHVLARPHDALPRAVANDAGPSLHPAHLPLGGDGAVDDPERLLLLQQPLACVREPRAVVGVDGLQELVEAGGRRVQPVHPQQPRGPGDGAPAIQRLLPASQPRQLLDAGRMAQRLFRADARGALGLEGGAERVGVAGHGLGSGGLREGERVHRSAAGKRTAYGAAGGRRGGGKITCDAGG